MSTTCKVVKPIDTFGCIAQQTKHHGSSLRRRVCVIDLALGDQLPTHMHVVEGYAAKTRMQVITDTQKISQEGT